MDGVKSEMVTWAVGRAGEGLQGLGCTIFTAANTCTTVADAVVAVRLATSRMTHARRCTYTTNLVPTVDAIACSSSRILLTL